MSVEEDGDNLRNDNHTKMFSNSAEIVKKIPLMKEKFSYTKQTKESKINIEKRWNTTVKKIEIPVSYEEIYIDGKRIEYYNENEHLEIVSNIKSIIRGFFFRSKIQESLDSHKKKDGVLKVKQYNEDNKASNEKPNTENKLSLPSYIKDKNSHIEHKITIWGDEITINKKKVKLGEFVIKKHQVTEMKKMDIELITDKLTIFRPNSTKEEII